MKQGDWKERTLRLIGEEGNSALEKSHVLIVGLGGVGSWAAEHIVRAGIGELSIVDADKVTVSNINRQLPALHSTIGRNKTEVISERLLDINPELKLHSYSIFFKEDARDKLFLNQSYDYVLDCIDTLSPKINLIRTCLEKNIPLISSLGSGAKTDHTAIKISDISKSYNCKLGRMLRKRLHKMEIYSGFKVIFSSEKPNDDAVFEDEGENKKSNAGTISYLPSLFGTMMAAEVILDILRIKRSGD